MMGQVLHNNVSLEVGSHDNILNKSMRREYYAETVERKRKAQHAIVTKNYCLAKKNYQEFKRQTKLITKINKKQVTGPQWFQELSEQQVRYIIKLLMSLTLKCTIYLDSIDYSKKIEQKNSNYKYEKILLVL
ncbi:uncharacterized protein LOC126554548 [Aphis gossypii]|uniref:uncharacterized protein LOC126554548 n=1 Tax=Aphis gossypii TaxID=80765 RepID=UPI0021594F70|nr:uncharacterized protein LOC126554548 [Aphis gossypii]